MTGLPAPARLIAWWACASPNLRGSILMSAALVILGFMIAAIKALGAQIPLAQTLFLRQAIMTALLMPLFARDLRGALRTGHPGLQVFRGMCSLGAMMCGFQAFLFIPMADATAIGFSQIVFTTILAVVILHEQVGLHRWIATGIGLLGVIVMLRPGSGAFEVHALLAVGGAVFGSFITITVRVLAQTERTETIMLWQAVTILIALVVPTLWLWVWPTPVQWALLVSIGITGTVGQFLLTRAYQLGEAAALAPLDFMRLLVAAILGFALFSETPDAVTFLGAALVAGSTGYTMHRNGRRKTPSPVAEP